MRTGSKRRRRPPVWPILTLILVALGCAFGAAQRLRQAARAEADVAALRAQGGSAASIVYIRLAGVAGEPAASVPAYETPAPPDPSIERVRALQRKNPELVGWLTMEAAGVDYPLMQSPSRPNFYIDHNFEGADSKSGLPYIDEACDAVEGQNRIIYGHNMKNGTMFGSLHRYLEADFFAENAEIRLDTPAGSERYRVIAAYETLIDENAAFRFWEYTDIADEDAYREYAANILARSVHEPGELPYFGQRLLTLVTCVRYRPNDRLLVVAAEIK